MFRPPPVAPVNAVPPPHGNFSENSEPTPLVNESSGNLINTEDGEAKPPELEIPRCPLSGVKRTSCVFLDNGRDGECEPWNAIRGAPLFRCIFFDYRRRDGSMVTSLGRQGRG